MSAKCALIMTVIAACLVGAHAQSSWCGQQAKNDTALVKFLSCTCAEAKCNKDWAMREDAHKLELGVASCDACRKTCHSVAISMSGQRYNRSFRALRATSRCFFKYEEMAWVLFLAKEHVES